MGLDWSRYLVTKRQRDKGRRSRHKFTGGPGSGAGDGLRVILARFGGRCHLARALSIFLARIDLSGAGALPAETRDALERTLDPAERARAARFVHDEDRSRFVVAHAGLRRWLGRALGCAPEAVRFREGPGGKPEVSPELLENRAFFFNLSHSRTLALVAWGAGPVGVDVEDVARGIDAQWARKEALLKALGTGLARDPASVQLIPGGEREGVWSWTPPGGGASWVVLDLDVGPAHRAALATTAPCPDLVFLDDQAL
jgi:4'-phosphopantetheinyl transferase